MRSMPRTRRFPYFRRGLGAVAANQLMQLELAVGRQKAGAASRRAAADDVLLDQNDLESLAQELRRRGDAAESAADDQHVALDVLRERRTVLVAADQQGGDPPVLIDHPHGCGHRRPLRLSRLYDARRSLHRRANTSPIPWGADASRARAKRGDAELTLGQQPTAVEHEIDPVHAPVREQEVHGPTTSSVVASRPPGVRFSICAMASFFPARPGCPR